MKSTAGVSNRHFKRLVQKELTGETGVNAHNSSQQPKKPNVASSNSYHEPSSSSHEPSIRSVINETQDYISSNDFIISTEIKNWCVKHQITRAATEDLLEILKKAGLSVPKSRNALMEIKSSP